MEYHGISGIATPIEQLIAVISGCDFCWLLQWIGFVGKIYRKPWFLPSNINGFPVKFPLIQFYDFWYAILLVWSHLYRLDWSVFSEISAATEESAGETRGARVSKSNSCNGPWETSSLSTNLSLTKWFNGKEAGICISYTHGGFLKWWYP